MNYFRRNSLYLYYLYVSSAVEYRFLTFLSISIHCYLIAIRSKQKHNILVQPILESNRSWLTEHSIFGPMLYNKCLLNTLEAPSQTNMLSLKYSGSLRCAYH